MTAHSQIGASSMYRWSACPGSVRLSKGIESKSSKYAEEGTEAHEIAANCLLKQNMVEIEPEMQEAIEVYIEFVRSLSANCKPGEMHVVDLKYGAGILVEVVDEGEINPQLQYYGLGAYLTVPVADKPRLLVEHKFDLSSIHPGCFGTADAVVVGAGPATKVHLHIVQPRCNHPDGPIRSHTIDAIDLLDFSVDLKDYAKATEDPNAKLVAGDHCRFCPASGVCPELARRVTAVAKLEFGPALSYDPQQLKLALDSRDIVKAWLKAVDEFAYAEAEAGRCPPGYKLVAKRATRKWRSEGEVIEALQAKGVKPDVMFEPRSLKSPAQLEKVIDKKVVAEFTVSESSGHTLAPESDKRPAVKPSAKEEFSEALT